MVSLPTAEQTGIGEEATQEANKAVQSLLSQQDGAKRKRKPYRRFSETDRATIGKYAAEHGNAEAMKRFKTEFPELPESTVRSFKIKYKDALESGASSIDKIPSKRRGRPQLLGEYDAQVQQFVKVLHKGGTSVTPQVVIAAAEGIISAKDKNLLATNGGSIQLSRTWAVSLMKRVGLRKRKGKDGEYSGIPSIPTTEDLSVIDQISTAVTTNNIPMELIISWEQFDMSLIPDGYGNDTDSSLACGNNSSTVVVMAVTMSGNLLPFQLVYDADVPPKPGDESLADVSPITNPNDFNIYQRNPANISDKESILSFLAKIILPYVERVRSNLGLLATQPAILIHRPLCDEKTDIETLLQDNGIISIELDSSCTDCDITFPIYQSVEEHLSAKFKEWYSGEVQQQLNMGKRVQDISVDLNYNRLKQLQADWLGSAYQHLSMNPAIVVSGFEKAGIISNNSTST